MGSGMARLEKKMLALKYKVGEVVRRAESRGDQVPDMRKRSKCVAPLASFSMEGDLKWNLLTYYGPKATA